ncbi:DUF4229 domain-containing protein [Isoptericola sp. NEAU-Y5]|uniref:DUF4229 domain-containing protein n=1 Tax=Isoptericola luteus TaxID=2879484 RepID=A0ABS7ZMB8_9MICO|nr:DUF4229 domain-containing protein [Isoptericola sp. NEAU-Y5]MCA5895024.1 DUF4229 domain-containing protein [Isoptericola sp. NEAU-Y5]
MPLVLYTLWRILIFVGALGLGYLLSMRSWLLVLFALVVAFAVSYLALRRPRDAAAAWLAERAERRQGARTGHDADTDFEDSVVDRENVDRENVDRDNPAG